MLRCVLGYWWAGGPMGALMWVCAHRGGKATLLEQPGDVFGLGWPRRGSVTRSSIPARICLPDRWQYRYARIALFPHILTLRFSAWVRALGLFSGGILQTAL